jgi:hypothetical protein
MLDDKTRPTLLAEFSWALTRYNWTFAEWEHQATNPNDDGDSERFYDWVVTPALEDCRRLGKELRADAIKHR